MLINLHGLSQLNLRLFLCKGSSPIIQCDDEQHWSSNSNVPLVWFLNLFGVKVLISGYATLKNQNFKHWNTFIKFSILSKLYQCNSWYTKLRQLWIKCLSIYSNSIIHLFDHKKIGPFHLSGFSQKFPNCGLLYFW